MKQFDIGDIIICLKPLSERESIPYFSEAKKVYSHLQSNFNYQEKESNKWIVTNISKTYHTILNTGNGKTILIEPTILQEHFIKLGEWRDYQFNQLDIN